MVSDTEMLDVLVVGAGPTGLTLACELARRGVNMRIIDKLEHATDKSKALVIHARTLELLNFMGVLPSFLEIGIPITGVSIYDSDRKIAHLTLNQIDSPYQFALGVPQSSTERLLLEFLHLNNGDVERNCELISVTEHSDHVVAKINKAGTEEELKCKYLVACDGAHSKTRHEIKEPFEGGEYQEDFQIADVLVDWGGRENQNEIYAFSGGNGNAAFFPMPENRWRVFTVLTEALSEEQSKREPTLEEIQAKINEVVPWRVRISDPVWLANFKIRYRKVKNYRHGRIFLAGDAAHCHSPVGGQGMNTGMQDAINLAWKLALAAKGQASEVLLDSYQFERNAVAEQLLKTVDMMTRVNLLRAPIAREIRNRLAPLLISHEVVQSRIRNFMTEIGISYRHSPIVAESKGNLLHAALGAKTNEPRIGDWFEFSQGPHAGDRAVDASLTDCDGNSIRVMDLFKGTRHHLLLFSGDSPSSHTYNQLCDLANAAYKKYSEFLDVSIISSEEEPTCELNLAGKKYFDAEYSAHERYGAGAPCMYLVRPDAYVGIRSQPVDLPAIDNYFSKIIRQ